MSRSNAKKKRFVCVCVYAGEQRSVEQQHPPVTQMVCCSRSKDLFLKYQY